VLAAKPVRAFFQACSTALNATPAARRTGSTAAAAGRTAVDRPPRADRQGARSTRPRCSARRAAAGRCAVRYASQSFERALQAQKDGFFAGEIVAVHNETFELEGYAARKLRLAGKVEVLDHDTHARPSPVEVLAKLRPLYPDGVQTGGNSSALVDAAAAAIVASGSHARGRKPLARIVASATVGVPPEIMGIGPAPAIRLLLERSGLRLDDIDVFEINEAQGAQILAVERELGLDRARLNIHGGAIALGHPLAATGVRLTVTAARALRLRKGRYAIASACVGGGQGIAVLLENPDHE
jgi:acetyl-CoA C-acetyltransferase